MKFLIDIKLNAMALFLHAENWTGSVDESRSAQLWTKIQTACTEFNRACDVAVMGVETRRSCGNEDARMEERRFA